MSEVLGRRIPLFAGYALFAVFQIPVALARNVATICVGRFISGFFASAPLAVVGGALADLWDPIPRAYAICIFAAGGFAGPVAGPIAGGFITESSLGWRWTSWITLIMAGFFGAIGLFVIPETSAARILQLRAANLRKETGNPNYHSRADENKFTFNTVVHVYLLRPFVMFVQEPILALITAYMSFLYGIVYLLFEAVSCSPPLSCNPALADTSSVSCIFLPRTRLVPRCLPASFCCFHCRHHHGCRPNRIQYRNQLYAIVRQAWKSHSRRTPSSYDSWCNRPSHWPFLVCMDQ